MSNECIFFLTFSFDVVFLFHNVTKFIMPEIAHHPLPSPSSFDAQTPSNYAPAPSNYAPALFKSPAAASSSSAPATIKPPASANFASAPASITPPAVAGSAGASASIEPHAVAGSAGAVTKPTVSAQNEHKSAAASKPSSGSLSLGSRIADQKYQVIDKLGQGSQGEVFHARRRSDGIDVAIKVLHIHSVKNWKQYELFNRESQTLMGLDIDGVAHLYETIEDLECEDPVSIIVQEYIRGYSLNSYIQAARRFTVVDIADIILQLLHILDALHNRPEPIIHRDIKPGNIMLVDELGKFKVWLIDFGAVANPQVKDGGSTVAGTYGYMPPEQLMGHPVPQSDIYAVGAVALYLFSGQSPESIEMQEFRYMIDPYLQHLPYSVTVLLRQMLEPNIRDRISDIRTIEAAFEAIKSSNYSLLQDIVGAAQKAGDANMANITSYRQGGAIDVWSTFSDSIPRDCEVPPNVVESLARIHPNIGKYISQSYNGQVSAKKLRLSCYCRPYTAYDMTKAMNFLRDRRRPNVSINKHYLSGQKGKLSRVATMAIYGIGSLLSLAVAIVAFVMTYNAMSGFAGVDVESLNIFEVIPAWISVISFVLCVWLLYCFVITLISPINYVDDLTKKLEPMFKYGRKTLATISNIEYISATDAIVPIEQPLWRIEYKFNPVDDESPDDLTRAFLTRLPPDDCSPGDFIPCLYIITHEDDGTEVVYSMPWPILAQDDVYLCDDVVKLLEREEAILPKQIQNIIE